MVHIGVETDRLRRDDHVRSEKETTSSFILARVPSHFHGLLVLDIRQILLHVDDLDGNACQLRNTRNDVLLLSALILRTVHAEAVESSQADYHNSANGAIFDFNRALDASFLSRLYWYRIPSRSHDNQFANQFRLVLQLLPTKLFEKEQAEMMISK